jgi:hypothetical protein
MNRPTTASLMLAACLMPLPAATLMAAAPWVDNQAVALSNEPPDQTLKRFDDPSVSDEGIIAALTDLKDGKKKRCIVLFGTLGGETSLICTGDASPVLSQAIKGIEQVKIASDSSFVSWVGKLSSGQSGVFTTAYDPATDTVGATKAHVVTGDPITAISAVVDNIIGGGVDEKGDVYFASTLSLAPANSAKNGVVARCPASAGDCGASGNWVVIAQEGDSVPDNGTLKFCAFEAVAFSDAGVTFKASAQTQANCTSGTLWLPGVYRKIDGDTLTTIGRRDLPTNPSDTPPGTYYSGFKGTPAMNAHGGTCFIASTKGVIEKYYTFCCDDASCPSANLPTAALGDMAVSQQGDSISVFVDLDVSAGDYLVVQTAKGVYGVTDAFLAPSPAFTVLTRDDNMPYGADLSRTYDAMAFKPGVGIAPGGSNCFITSQGDAKGADGLVKPKVRKALYLSEDTICP